MRQLRISKASNQENLQKTNFSRRLQFACGQVCVWCTALGGAGETTKGLSTGGSRDGDGTAWRLRQRGYLIVVTDRRHNPTAAAEKRSIRVRIPPIIVHHTYSATYGFPSVPPGSLPQLPPTIPSQLTTQTIHTWPATRLSQTQPRPIMAVVVTVSSTLAAVDDLDGRRRSSSPPPLPHKSRPLQGVDDINSTTPIRQHSHVHDSAAPPVLAENPRGVGGEGGGSGGGGVCAGAPLLLRVSAMRQCKPLARGSWRRRRLRGRQFRRVWGGRLVTWGCRGSRRCQRTLIYQSVNPIPTIHPANSTTRTGIRPLCTAEQ
ncbi:hypothetical protein QTP88_026211 [Uroleucon formosanum]